METSMLGDGTTTVEYQIDIKTLNHTMQVMSVGVRIP